MYRPIDVEAESGKERKAEARLRLGCHVKELRL